MARLGPRWFLRMCLCFTFSIWKSRVKTDGQFRGRGDGCGLIRNLADVLIHELPSRAPDQFFIPVAWVRLNLLARSLSTPNNTLKCNFLTHYVNDCKHREKKGGNHSSFKSLKKSINQSINLNLKNKSLNLRCISATNRNVLSHPEEISTNWSEAFMVCSFSLFDWFSDWFKILFHLIFILFVIFVL